MIRTAVCTLALVTLGAALASCGGDGGGDRRIIPISQTDEDCTPATIDLKPSEKVRFEVKNEGKKDREVEGIEGTKLEELLIPSGRTRSINYTAPSKEGTQKVKCYTPGGASTIIELRVAN